MPGVGAQGKSHCKNIKEEPDLVIMRQLLCCCQVTSA